MRPTDPAATTEDHTSDRTDESGASYLRFVAMVATSVVVMYGLQYTNSWAL